MKRLLLIIGLNSLFIVLGHFYLYLAKRQIDTTPPPRILVIEKGDSLGTMAAKLQQLQTPFRPQVFIFYAKLTQRGSRFKAGEYELPEKLSLKELFDLLEKGTSREFTLTLPEGINRFEIAELLKREGFSVAASQFLEQSARIDYLDEVVKTEESFKAILSLEGFLFPETYKIARTISASALVRLLLQEFSSRWNRTVPQYSAHEAKALGLSPYEILTLASMVEKETGAASERPQIAGVFYNRLKKRMRLQSDPTTIYGLLPQFSGNITRKDLLSPHDWNTYTVPALPKTPICNPGEAALAAVLEPSHHSYLYFVSHNDGTHEFSETYESHQNAVKNFQLNPKAREGKSWRQLKK